MNTCCLRLFRLLACAVAATVVMCSSAGDAAMSPGDPPLPRVASIIPLTVGNEWVFHDVIRDTLDLSIADTSVLHLRIPFAYGRTATGDTILVSSGTYWGYQFVEYFFAYEWENLNRGYLLTYRDVDVPVRGVYIVGEYNFALSESMNYYDSAKLWLAYPAVQGDAWQYESDSGSVLMELVSRDTLLYFVNRYSGKASPIEFVPCYLYGQSDTLGTRKYFFNKDYGPVGYQWYTPGGKLRRTYLLTAFHDGSRYYY